MGLENTIQVVGGSGATSYAQNSSLQKKQTDVLKHLIFDTATKLVLYTFPPCFNIADLGCSSGPNALTLIGEIVNAINEKCVESLVIAPEIMVFLNDLPSNDFNSLFKSIPDFNSNLKCAWRQWEQPSVYVVGVPGTFYGRLFPSNSLHFVHCGHSLHWLSQVPSGLFGEDGKPINKEKIYISETSPPGVAKAYLRQFQKDFGLFLKCRSEEMLPEGRLVLIFSGRATAEPSYNKKTTILWELLARSMSILATQGDIQEEKIHSYNAPFYCPSLKEIEDEVHNEGSFIAEHLDTYECKLSNGDPERDGEKLAMAIRTVQGSMISHYVGEEVMDRLFEKFSELLSEAIAVEDIPTVLAFLVLKKG